MKRTYLTILLFFFCVATSYSQQLEGYYAALQESRNEIFNFKVEDEKLKKNINLILDKSNLKNEIAVERSYEIGNFQYKVLLDSLREEMNQIESHKISNVEKFKQLSILIAKSSEAIRNMSMSHGKMLEQMIDERK